MHFYSQQDKMSHILEKAKAFGASLAGITSVVSLRNAPSYQVYGQAQFPTEAKSALVLALVHDEDNPELDWWGVKGGTAGNQRLIQVSNHLKSWLKEEYHIQAQPLAYHVAQGRYLKEKGGIFLKDAAVLAGLGCLGANNLLITSEYGPRVRLRALFLDVDLASTGPVEFSPCESCDMPCKQVCPQNAFSFGSYNRTLCAKQMQRDEANKVIVKKALKDGIPEFRIKYCRACELACPVYCEPNF